VLAVLYFALMELMLIDSSRSLHEAQRFRARIVATTMAESAAELAAAQLVTQPSANVSASDEQGTMTATMNRGAPNNNEIPFTIDAHAEEIGVPNQKAAVAVQGRIVGMTIHVDYTTHGY
jgi:glucose/arabinose dehydrogenase